MSEEQVFLAALDLPDAAARAAYLDENCSEDAEFRRQVEALLAAHFRTGEFLDVPAAEQVQAGSQNENTLTSSEDAVSVVHDREDESDDLKFLTPSSRPDSLGRLGHYEMLQVLGRGGFGIVFRASDDILQRMVAVKVMAPQIATLSPARKRFLREARSSAQVRHENVVQVYEVGEQPLPYLAMEFIPGETLQQRLDRTGPVEVPEVLRIGRQVAEGLAAAHACDLIHRDIKPGNILLEGGSHKAKITDFGLARAADDASISQSGIIAGTPMFMAPEQALGHKIDQRADLFSLGSVLYQMASGRPPFRAPSALAVLKRVAEETPRPIPEIIPETPAWLCAIIAKLHAKNPDERYQSAREIADVLADCETQLKAHAKLKDYRRIPRSQPRRSGRWKWAAVAAAVLLPVIALAVMEFAGVTHLSRLSPPKKNADQFGPAANTAFDAKEAQEASAKQLGIPVETINSIGMKLRFIPPGKSTMGSSKEEIDYWLKQKHDGWYKELLLSEGPQHEVEITQPFYLGQTDVTVGQFRQFVKATGYQTQAERKGSAVCGFPNGGFKEVANTNWLNPGYAQTDDHPVVCVSWNDAVEFCQWLSKEEGRTYRLPTEAEWEYSCRTGSKGRWSFGDNEGELWDYARVGGNSQNHAWPVAGLKANAWGLYDMHGNVEQWCQDSFDPNYYKTGPLQDPPGPVAGDERVARGGFWLWNDAWWSRSAMRHKHNPAGRANFIGFRVVLVVSPPAGVGTASGTKNKPAPKAIPPLKRGDPQYTNTLEMKFKLIPAGKFTMGSPKEEIDRSLKQLAGAWPNTHLPFEGPEHPVEITQPFYLGAMEVTVGQFRQFVEEGGYQVGDGRWRNPGFDQTDKHPVVWVSWNNAVDFCKWLSAKEGKEYRLPTEAEWEYCCRAGKAGSRYCFGDDEAQLEEYAWYATNAGPRPRFGQPPGVGTHPVGKKKPNAWGLYGMHGNAWEWCQDNYDPDYYKNSPVKDPSGGAGGGRVARGGSYPFGPVYCRSAFRGYIAPGSRHGHGGFRVLLVSPPAGVGTKSGTKNKPAVPALAPFSDADVQRIAALPAAQQVEEVRKELRRRNPDFDGKMETKIGDSVVTEFRIVTDHVTDIAPIRVWSALRVLDCSGTWRNFKANGLLADLTPLKGMNLAALTHLKLPSTKVGDAGMVFFKDCKNLTHLDLFLTQVSDAGLVHFKDRKNLTHLALGWTKVSDAGLANFKDCKNLTELWIHQIQVGDAGMVYFQDCKALKNLNLAGTKVSDAGLAHFKDCKNMKFLYLDRTEVSDAGLTQLKGMLLRELNINETGITDLTPLQGMPLEHIRLTPKNITRGMDVLRNMKSLETIGLEWKHAWPAAEFWQRYDKGQFK